MTISTTAVFKACKKLTGATAGFVGVPSADGTRNEVVLMDSGGMPSKVDPNLLMPMRGLWKEVYDTGRVIYLNDFPGSAYAKFLPDGHVNIENVLMAPLMECGKRMGLLGLANKPEGFTEADVRIVSGLADITTIDDAALRQGSRGEDKNGLDPQSGTSRESFALKMALNLAKSPSRKEYLDAVMEMVRSWSGCNCVGIRMLDDLGNMPFESYVGFSKEFWEWENWLSTRNDVCICTRIMTEKTESQDSPITTPSGSFRSNNMHGFLGGLARDKRKRFRGMCPKYGYLSLAFVPIRYRGRVIGAIHIADEEEGKVPPELVEFLESITPLMGESIQRFNLEDELHVRLNQQVQLADFGKRALTGADLPILMNEASTMVAQTLKVDYVGLLELLPGGKELHFLAGVGWGGEVAGKVISAGADSLEGRTILSGKATIVTDLHSEAQFGGSQFLLAHKVVSGMGVVIPGKGQPFGLLGVYTAIWRKFTEYDINFLLRIANILAEAISRKRAEESLLREGRKNEALLRAASDGIHILDLEGNVVQVNDTFCRMLGYTAEELSTMNAAQWDAQWNAAQIRANIAMLKDDAAMLATRHRCRDGSIIDVEVSIVKVDVDGQQVVYCSSRDVTKHKQAERALIESEGKLHAIIETALDAVVQMNDEEIITGWNHQAEKIFGWRREEAVGQSLSEIIIPPQYREAHKQGLKHFLASGKANVLNSRIELLGLHRDGHEFPVELTVTAINTAGKYEFNGFIRDITRQKESEELIWNQANFDTLTGLPNRRMFHDRLAQEIKKAHRAGLKAALLYIDLDKFKEVNDTLGHSIGDILLKEAARRIGGCVRETDTVARMGGDEFTVILAELDDTGSVERVIECILQGLAEPFRLGARATHVSASIGIALYPDDATVAEDLLKYADQAMYAAKHAGRNGFSYFTQSMQQTALTKLHLISELRGALAASQFRIYYQPIVDFSTGRINKAEALIRWQHPELGMVSPAEFIPLAEETGLIVEIGDWVFRETAQQVKRWRTLYNSEIQASVNVSPTQFRQSGNACCKAWIDYLQELGLPGQSIAIEITEGLLLDAEPSVTDKLLEFRDAGLQVSIDDFGTGYSALSYLKKFDIDYLKIDKSFVRDLVTDPNDMALSEAIIMMAHKLGLKVIAEGVETEAQRKLLADAGCDYAQGYLFSRPVPAEEFEVLLKKRD